MRWKLILPALALAFVGCGGGSTPPADTSGGDTSGGDTSGGDAVVTSAPLEQVVVEMDINGDDQPDVVTLDTTEAPFAIVEVLEGSATGRPVDTTDLHKGLTIDAEVSKALAEYLAGSFGVATRAELDCQKENGDAITVVVLE